VSKSRAERLARIAKLKSHGAAAGDEDDVRSRFHTTY